MLGTCQLVFVFCEYQSYLNQTNGYVTMAETGGRHSDG